MLKQKRLPDSRAQRLLSLGKLVGGVATSALAHGVSQTVRGNAPSLTDALLNPNALLHVKSQLSEMRGAALKLGQLLSMDAGQILPKELADLLASLRDSAHSMTDQELHSVLSNEWGKDWRKQFDQFDMQPFAAASIGQVHRARDKDGRELAIKIQYPRVEASIDSDVDNAMTIIRMSRLLPASLNVDDIVTAAKDQLHREADYLQEAAHITSYTQNISGFDNVGLPTVLPELTSQRILTMSYMDGSSIESVAESMDQESRNNLVETLIRVTLSELLIWGQVQSDPNFANFLYNEQSGDLGLVDFGAVVDLSTDHVLQLNHLLRAIQGSDLPAINEAAHLLGYISSEDPFNYRVAILSLLQTAAEPVLYSGTYDFGRSDLPQRMTHRVYELRRNETYQRIPPAIILFLHRKLAGIYMLATRLQARINVRRIVEDTLVSQGADNVKAG